MRDNRRGKVVLHGSTLVVTIVLFTAIGLAIGLVLPSPFRIEEKDLNGASNITEPPSFDELLKDTPQPESTDNLSEKIFETPTSNIAEALPTQAPPSTAAPSNGQGDTVREQVVEYVASMSLREKICQMLIVTPDAITGVSGTTFAGSTTKAALEKYPVGGLIHFSSNIKSGEQITSFNTTVQEYSKIPLFIAVDEEGGRVGRLKTSLQAHSVGAMLTYEDDGEHTAYDNAQTLSAALKKYAFNTDFAPVADVWSNRANTVVGDRAYSTDFATAAKLVSAAVRGFDENNVVCSLKHFPGHGDTREDSHSGAAFVDKTLSELRRDEFKPFESGISAGADMVMVGHLIVSDVDELPATLSKVLMTDILRGELGFQGVIITDSLAMGAISSNYSAAYVAVTAVKAGVDILLMPSGVEKTISALTAAIESGDIPESRIDESVRRIISLKAARGILNLDLVP